MIEDNEPSSFNMEVNEVQNLGLMIEINKDDLIKTVTIKNPN